MNSVKEEVIDIECLIKESPSLTPSNITPRVALQNRPLYNSQKNIRQSEWRSCCFALDKSAVKYFTQITILSGLIVLSGTMLVLDNDCISQRNWSALLMICLGVFLKAPTLDSN
jgi:hypothetical protein